MGESPWPSGAARSFFAAGKGAAASAGATSFSDAAACSCGAALSAVFSGGSPVVQRGVRGAYGMGGKLGVLLPFSRKHEAEADEIGLVLMAKAGFDPGAALDFWHRFLVGGRGGQAPEILSSHPSGEERLRRLEELMPVANEYYRKAVAVPRRPEDESATPPDIPPEEIIRRLRESEPLD